MAAPTTTPRSMKLLVDTNSRRVLFAEASKEVVDTLFSLLALPAVALVEPDLGRRGAGSVGNLHPSAEKLGYAYAQPGAANKGELPAPPFEPSRTFFRCHHNYRCCGHRAGKSCGAYMTDVRGTRCPNCASEMTAALHYVPPPPAWSRRANPSQIMARSTSSSQGFAAAYTVLDDLTVTPMSAISSITLLNSFAVTDLAALQDRTVRLGYTEGLGILKASLHSKTVLTDVFLGDW